MVTIREVLRAHLGTEVTFMCIYLWVRESLVKKEGDGNVFELRLKVPTMKDTKEQTSKK